METTGADSVPFPDGPCSDSEWRAYKAACERAAFVETTDEAATRCWQSATEFGVSKAFMQCRLGLVGLYDAHYSPGEVDCIGMALDECSPVSEWVLRELTQHWARMVAAWSVMDRDEYVKAVNDFSVAAAVLATGLDIAENDKNR
jgi:hypothetical protein